MAKKDYSNFTKEELLEEVKKLEKRKKYGIVWEDKPEKVAEMCKEKLPVLEEDTKKEIVTDKEKDYNILIEGDNYHALSVLNYTHKGKIDLIYIDPPYNTGKSNEWKYNDKWVDENDAYKHSEWLSFIEKRLRLAKPLLKDSGIIFISIDDNEIAQLKLLCDELFGENNLIALIAWQSTETLRNDTKYFSPNCEFILVYGKNKEEVKIRGILKGEKQKGYYKNPDNDPRGPYLQTPLHAKSGNEKNRFAFRFSNGQIWEPPKGRYWAFSKETLERLDKEKRLYLDPKRINVPRKKTYLSEVSNLMRPWTFWRYEDFGTTRQGNAELRELMGRGFFDNPKPTKLLKKIIDLVIDKYGVVLDFFAGSGTTGHAVLELNKLDSGDRKFILCTNNEGNICNEVCYPRIKKVINNLEQEEKKKLVKNMPGNLKYFKTDFVDAEPTDKNKEKIVKKSTEMLCLKEDCFNEIESESNFCVFTNNKDKFLGIVYEDEGISKIKKVITKLNKKMIVYVFSLDDSAREDQFEDVKNLVELRPIPAVILNVYRRIFK